MAANDNTSDYQKNNFSGIIWRDVLEHMESWYMVNKSVV